MSAFSAAASDEDDDIIQALRAKNEELTHQIELLRHVAQTRKKKAGDLEAKIAAAPQPPVAKQRMPAFESKQVQAVYEILCDTECVGKPRDEHWEGWQARRIVAALEQPQVGEVVVTTNQEGQCVAVTRQDEEGHILSVIWEAQQPQVEQEPVAWQHRMRAEWMRDGEWEPWRDCSKGVADDCKQVPVIDDWEYESRPLYTLPQPKRQPLTEADLYDIAGNYFADEWAQKQAVMMLKDHGIGDEK